MMPADTPVLDTSAPRRSAIVTGFRVLAVFDTVALLIAAALHIQGVRISLGSADFVEPQIVPAAIVEGLAGLIFAVAAYALFTSRRWAWAMTLSAHVFAILGFLLGIWSTRNGTSPFNHDYHLIMLGIFVVGLALLLTPAAHAALRHGGAARLEDRA
jgi:hypothetical protein